MNKSIKRKNSLVISLTLVIISIIVVTVGVFVYKHYFKDSSSQKPIENNNQPSQTSPPSVDLPIPFEEYLSEKRLELKKYFVFNFGKELKTKQQKRNDYKNQRWVTENLAKDLTKLTTFYEKRMEEKGYGVIVGKVGEYEGRRCPKEAISFVTDDFLPDEEWIDDKLDSLITKFQQEDKDAYIIFEKDIEFPKTFFQLVFVDKQGKQWFAYHGAFFLRRPPSAGVYLFLGKEAALNFLKDNDPALSSK